MGPVVTGRPWWARGRSRPLLAVGAWCASAGALLGLAVLLGWLTRSGWAVGLDRDGLAHIARLRQPQVTTALRWVSVVGGPQVLLVAAAAVGALLAWGRRGRAALLVVTSAAGALAVTAATKWLVARPRPASGALVGTQGFALPSSHSAVVVACLGAAALGLGGAVRRRAGRAVLWAAVAVAAAAVGFSRVYLGAHWPSDVLLGWAMGGAWLAICAVATATLVPAPRAGSAGREHAQAAGRRS